MIKLSEFLKQGSLFNELETIKPMPFLSVDDNAVLDSLLTLKYGERTVYSKLLTTPFPDIAKMLVKTHGDYWDGLLQIDGDELPSSRRTLTETITTNENRNNTRDDKNVVAAFNSDDLITNDGTLVVGADDLTGNKTRILTDENNSLNSAYYHLSLKQKNNIMNVVLLDVASFLTLSIY